MPVITTEQQARDTRERIIWSAKSLAETDIGRVELARLIEELKEVERLAYRNAKRHVEELQRKALDNSVIIIPGASDDAGVDEIVIP